MLRCLGTEIRRFRLETTLDEGFDAAAGDVLGTDCFDCGGVISCIVGTMGIGSSLLFSGRTTVESCESEVSSECCNEGGLDEDVGDGGSKILENLGDSIWLASAGVGDRDGVRDSGGGSGGAVEEIIVFSAITSFGRTAGSGVVCSTGGG